jgi:hypothetical protein
MADHVAHNGRTDEATPTGYQNSHARPVVLSASLHNLAALPGQGNRWRNQRWLRTSNQFTTGISRLSKPDPRPYNRKMM